jgi:hypothetical protein
VDDALQKDVRAFFASASADEAERGKLLTALARMAQFSLVALNPADPVPESCRAIIIDRATRICSGLDIVKIPKFVSILADVPAEEWSKSGREETRRLARVAWQDISALRRAQSDAFTSTGVAALDQLKRNLAIGARPGNLVTLQFAGGDFERENAQVIMDRLVSVGWKLLGVQRVGLAAGLNEIRAGNDDEARKTAALLASDLEVQGLTARPNSSLGSSSQLDIYISRPLPLWASRSPKYAWCFQRLGRDRRYSVRCHESHSACKRWADPNRVDADRISVSSCSFAPFLDEVGFRAEAEPNGSPKRGNGGSVYEYRPSPFGGPFPQLPKT